MAARFNVLLLAVLACAAFGFAAAQTGVTLPGTKEDTRGADGALCAGPPAKIRYQWAHDLKDPSPATFALLDKIIGDWMKLCSTKEGGSVLRYNQGSTKAKSPADYGYKGAVPSTVTLAQYGAWSDWSSMEDLQACYDAGRKAGLLAKSRGLAKNTYRVVYSLDNLKGSPKAGCMSAASNAPAKIRFMTFYTLKDASPAGSKMASDLYYKALVRNWVRTASGPDVVDDMDIEKLYGAGIKRTANFGGFIDFKSIPEMTAQFLDPASAADTAKLRALPVTSVRFAMEL